MTAFRHILFPVDFSEQCRAIRPAVQNLARRCGAKITLLHSIQIAVGWYGAEGLSWEMLDIPGIERDICGQLKRFFEPSDQAAPIDTIVEEGDPGDCITRFAERNGVDLIMMPTHGYGAFRGLLLGSVAAKVLHGARCPVWTAAHTGSPGAPPQFPGDRILCAVDLAAESVALIRYADGLAREFSAKLSLVHAVGNVPLGPQRSLDIDFRHFMLQSGREEMAKLQCQADTNVGLTVNVGSISHVVRDVASTLDATVVIIGRGKQHETLGRLRTSAYAIIRDSPCPVLSI